MKWCRVCKGDVGSSHTGMTEDDYYVILDTETVV